MKNAYAYNLLFPFALLLLCMDAGAATTYTYDPLSRLTRVDYGTGQSVNYTYDAAGNRLTKVVVSPNAVDVATAVAPVANGTVSGGGAQVAGSTVTVSATPASGDHFVNWTEGGVVVSNLPNYSFTAGASHSLVANFAAGSASTLVLTPDTLNFASQGVGTGSASQNVVVTNTGTTALSIGNIGISGDFGEANGCGTSFSYGATCSFTVYFTPTAAGLRSGELSFTSSAAGSPFSVSLTGTGVLLPSQTITFNALPPQKPGQSIPVSATASSGLPVSFSSTTPSVCTVSGTTVTLHAVGLCTIAADQAGNASYAAAPEVTRSFRVGATPIDFNTDGNSDLLWTHSNGAASAWLMNGTTQQSVAVYGPYTGWSMLSGDVDFNGDGMSDLLWSNSNGAASIWLMNGSVQQGVAVYGPFAGWTVVSGNNDFNGDGKSDLLWSNSNGAASIWLMNGTTVLSQAVYGPYSGWSIVSGNNDFNGDGKSDLLWKNTDGSASIWLMNGTSQQGVAVYGPYSGWTVASGSSDYNGNGMTDLLWTNTNGAASIWLMNGTAQQGVAVYGPYSGWTVVPGNRDFNGDGKSDLLWQNTNGAASIWLMNGITQQSSTVIGPYAGWSILGGIGDYNGDGMTDLLWQNTDGSASIWLMNGASQQGVATYGPYPGWSPMTGTTGP